MKCVACPPVADGYQGLTSGSITGVGVTITGARAKIVEVDFRDCPHTDHTLAFTVRTGTRHAPLR